MAARSEAPRRSSAKPTTKSWPIRCGSVMEASVCTGQLDVAVGASVDGERAGGDGDAKPELARTAGVVAGEDAAGEVVARPLPHAPVTATRSRARPSRMP